jgi:hypothetical protein
VEAAIRVEGKSQTPNWLIIAPPLSGNGNLDKKVKDKEN